MKFLDQLKQKNKKFYIKWTMIGVSAIMAALAAMWLYIHNWDAQQSMNALMDVVTIEEPATPATQEQIVEVPEIEEPVEEEPVEEKPVIEEPKEETVTDATVYSENNALPKEPTIINGILLVNKQHPLPENYAPGEVPEARAAFETMKAAAAEAGINLHAFSTYRNFTRQKQLYEQYVAKDGQKAADRYSARPGYSEHQTGLTFDIGEAGKEQHWAAASFGDTEGGKWLAANAHKYGFILRYLEGKEKVTGYMYESWHFRYVGNDVATEIYEKGITLEEYLEVN
ncbi:M15 family metallopeptidase [Planococcus donghaensis]|uniref:D-alanyl-D-alanine carboxypeptidase n=1 Tax=Planococcus donghaensis TaxID=414778 RepID=A0A1C7EKH9_9BACL|nr:M15 family metallopeptidase [Planococcus donghaensis]ANU24329.1 D-alanyl-D-alanine carboxypeptidase [Planococcus donghaensis]